MGNNGSSTKPINKTGLAKSVQNNKFIVDSLKDFPEDVRKKLEKTRLGDQMLLDNFRVLINVLNFYYLGDKNFRTSEDEKKEQELKEQLKVEQQKLEELREEKRKREEEKRLEKLKEEELKKSKNQEGGNSNGSSSSKVSKGSSHNSSSSSISKDSNKEETKKEENASEEPQKKYTVHELQIIEGEKLSIMVENKNMLRNMYNGFNEQGEGGFGQVFRAQEVRTKRAVAVKKMRHRTVSEIKMNFGEIFLLEKCKHKNIVEFVESLVIPELGELWVVMEYLEGVTLSKACENTFFSEEQIAFVAHQTLNGLRFLHKIEIIHRDIKTENIMLTNKGEIKLIDFGFCRSMKEGPIIQTVGSPFFVPPEMINKKPHSYPADIWSFGISIMEIGDGKVPNYDSPIKAMFLAGIGKMPKLKNSHIFTKEMSDFLALCLAFEPEKRSSADDLLEHDFLKNVDTKKQLFGPNFYFQDMGDY